MTNFTIEYPIPLSEDGTVRKLNVKLPNAGGLISDVESFLSIFAIYNIGNDIMDASNQVIYATAEEVHYRLTKFLGHGQLNNRKIEDVCEFDGSLPITIYFMNPITNGTKSTFDGYIGLEPSYDINSIKLDFKF